MSLVGKILAVLCVLAACAFAGLAMANLKTRREWSHAVFRHDIAIDGLPIDANQGASERDKLVDLLSDADMKELSSQAGGEPLQQTQQQELESLKKKLDAELANLKDDAKAKRLIEILKPLKQSSDARNALSTTPPPPLATLEADYNRTFEEAKAPLYDSTGKPLREPEEKRRAIAHLLFNYKLDDDWHKRVLTVVGLKAYTLEADRQADAFAAMVPPIEKSIIEERNFFASNHQRILKDIQVLNEELENRQAVLVKEQKKNMDRDELVKSRQATLDGLKKQLEADRKELQAQLARQAALEKALFDAQRRTRDASAYNQKAEQEIRRLEGLQKQVEADRKRLQEAMATQAGLENALVDLQRRIRDASTTDQKAEVQR